MKPSNDPHFDTSTVKHKYNDVVRTKTTFLRTSNIEDRYYKIDLMYFDDYVNRSSYITYGSKFEMYPYKWWEIQKFWTIPSFKISSYLLKRRLITWRHTNIAVNITIFSIEFISLSKILANIKVIWNLIFSLF